jgi:two-component system sensor histidine kinase CpxA
MRSLYTRVFLSFWIVMIVVVGGAIVVTGLVISQRAEQLPRVSARLVAEAVQALRDGGEPRHGEWLRGAQADLPGFRVLAFDADGRELLGRPAPPWLAPRLRGRVEETPQVADTESRAEAYGLPDGAALALPEFAPPPGSPLGVRVIPAEPLPVLVTPDGRQYRVLVLPPSSRYGPFAVPETRWAVFLLALLVSGAASWWLTRSITAPVGALGAATRSLAGGDLDARVDSDVAARRDELGVLARDFDAMAAQLRDLVQGKERLLRDISHELRSPLARMRVAVGLARQPGSDAGRELDRLETEIERLDRLIGQVLHLSRLDAAGRADLADDLDVTELVDGIARDAAFEAQGRGVTIDWQPPPAAARVRGHGDWLASAIENVVRNAVRYTAVGTAVGIRLDATAGAVVIRVRDHGPGVPAEDLQRIFEPFHRVAESRTRDSGGDGIGLAITARVFAAHRGSARAANAPGGGLEVTLTLPAAAA